MKPFKLSDNIQCAVADVLTQFMFTNTMDDVWKVWDSVFDQYDLCSDPFTDTPCSPKEYSKNKLEYERQIMIDKFGHCDGLE